MKVDAEATPGQPIPDPVRIRLVRQLTGAVPVPATASHDDVLACLKSAIERMAGIKPKGPVEDMLAVQMVATHEAAMECLRRAMLPEQTYEGREQNLKHATKLMGLYERQVAALDKHRGGGQPNVTVKHVYVAEGGQAIVGDVIRDATARIPKAPMVSELHAPGETPLELLPARQALGDRR